jgi:hydrogenase maturation protease
MRKTLLLGYGNIDREDDGVAWHALTGLANELNVPFPHDPSEVFEPLSGNPAFFFSLQLTPEFAEEIAQFERVCFLDAHTGNYPAELNFQQLSPAFQNSPFTHHLTPQSCLALAETLYGKAPEAILVSIKGYEFGFSRNLSEQTGRLVKQAVARIINWLFDDEKYAETGHKHGN